MNDQQDEMKTESLHLLQRLHDQLKKNDPRRQMLQEVIQDVQTDAVPYPVQKEDWEALCATIGLNAEELRYRKILYHFSREEKDYYQQVRKTHLKK